MIKNQCVYVEIIRAAEGEAVSANNFNAILALAEKSLGKLSELWLAVLAE